MIEWLKFQVPEALRERFIQVDEAVWTTALAKYPGFMGKEVWLSTEQPDEIVFVIQWASLEAWKSIPENVLQATEQQFAAQLGDISYTLTEATAYQLRKFARSQ